MSFLRILFVFTAIFASTAQAYNCRKGMIAVFNQNATQAANKYKNTNNRILKNYFDLLGAEFKSRITFNQSLRFLDSGGGYSRPGLKIAVANPKAKVTSINTQDYWAPVLDYKNNESVFKDALFAQSILYGTLVDLGSANDDLVTTDTKGNKRLIDGWRKKAADQLSQIIKSVSDSGRFNYLIGYVENILPRLAQKFDVIADVFGAYYYSGSRAELIDAYYRKLPEGGVAFVIISSTDIIKLNEYGEERWKPYEHGPIVTVKQGDRVLNFEDYLVKEYRSVFSVIEAGGDNLDSTKTRVLVIHKDPKIADLGLSKKLGEGKKSFPDTGDTFKDELPTTEY